MRRLLLGLVLFFALIMVFGCVGGETPGGNSQPGASTFEQVGYWKSEKLPSGAINRVFTVYTDETDETKLVEHAQGKMYTQFGYTYVHFYNNKDLTPSISNSLDVEIVMSLPDDGRVMVYHKSPNGNEFVWDGNMSENKQL